MERSLYNLTKTQLNIFKGICIIGILLHNYLHLTNAIGENEFQFESNRIFTLLRSIQNDPFMIFNGFFTYCAIYVLQVFIFATGYGMTKQFMTKKPTSYFRYLILRIIKIYGLFFFGAIIYFILMYYPSGFVTVKGFIEFTISSCLLFKNFSYDTIFSLNIAPFLGPFWYFGFIIQIYIFFPLFYNVMDKFGKKGLFAMIAISYIFIYALLPTTERIGFPMFGNLLGHLPVLLLSMGFAKFEDLRLDYKIILPTLCIFILSNFYSAFFPLSFMSAAILMFYFLYPIYTSTSKYITKPFIFVGSISMIIFVLNGSLRIIPLGLGRLIDGSGLGNGPSYLYLLISLLHLCTTVLICYYASIVYNKLYTPFFVNRAISLIAKK